MGCSTVADLVMPDALSVNFSESTGDFYSRTVSIGLTFFIPQPSQLQRKPVGNRRFYPGRLPSGLSQLPIDDGHATLYNNTQ